LVDEFKFLNLQSTQLELDFPRLLPHQVPELRVLPHPLVEHWRAAEMAATGVLLLELRGGTLVLKVHLARLVLLLLECTAEVILLVQLVHPIDEDFDGLALVVFDVNGLVEEAGAGLNVGEFGDGFAVGSGQQVVGEVEGLWRWVEGLCGLEG